jgi:hypothetical protein
MNPKIRIVLVIVFFCAFIANLIVIFYQHKKVKSLLEEIQQPVEKMRWENILLKEGFFQSYNYENTVIDYSDYVSNVNDESIKFQDLLSDKNWLILFMSVGSCRDCMYDNIEFIKDLKKKKVNVLIGIEGLTVREFKSFINQYELENIAYRLPDNFFPQFSINPAVYFVIDKNLRSKYFYAPSLAFPDLTKDYFDIIERFINLK